jgi:hypothetical protein
MESYSFFLDTKVTTWMRTEFEIEADSLEDAKLKAIEFHKQGNTSDISWEDIMDTQEPMSVEDNDGQPTEELYCAEDSSIIFNNGKLVRHEH